MSAGLKALVQAVLPEFPQVAPDSEVDVLHELPIETLYLALKESDTDTALWFFENALPEQVQGVIDLDCWEGSEFLPGRYENLFKALCLITPIKLAEHMRQLDPEVVVRGLLEMVKVEDFDPTEPPDLPPQSYLVTLDSKYLLLLKTENPELREALYLWLNKFSAADLELLRLRLEACKWEIPSDLEEFAYQMKRGRLEDHGFVDYHEAIGLYATGKAAQLKAHLRSHPLAADLKFPPPRVPQGEESESQGEELLPEIFTRELWGSGFLREALSRVKSPSRRRVLLMEILRTENAALAADKLLHESLEAIRRGTLRAKAYLELGLLYLSDRNPDQAASLLETQPLQEVYRLGWLAVQDLVSAAEVLRTHLGTKLFTEIDQRLLGQLQGRHPELGPDEARDLKLAPDPQGLRHLEAILAVGERLALLSQIGTFFMTEMATALRLREDPLGDQESAFSRLLTGLFRQSADLPLSFAPISSGEWPELASKSEPEKLTRLAEILVQRCPEPARALFRERLLALVSDLSFYLKSGGLERYPDPRFFKALRLAPAQA